MQSHRITKVVIPISYVNTKVLINKCFRLSLLISFQSDSSNISATFIPFLNISASVFSLQSDSVYNSFLELKESLEKEIAAIQALSKTAPPFGIYSQRYLTKYYQAFIKDQSITVQSVDMSLKNTQRKSIHSLLT